MNPEEAKLTAKEALGSYLTARKINISKNFSCLNPLHEDRNPSMSFDPKRNRIHCFSCGADYDIFDLFGVETGLSGKELFNHVYETLGIHVKYNFLEEKVISSVGTENSDLNTPHMQEQDMTLFFQKCHDALNKTDYWQKRGLSKETCDTFNIGYWEEKNRLVIPTGKASYNARAIDAVEKRYRYLKPKGTYQLFNLKALSIANESVFVVEGEFDALSVIEAGGIAVALGSSGSSAFLEYAKANRPEYPLILALDNDEAGRAGEGRLREELDKSGIPYVSANITGNFKDANEALVHEKDFFFQAVKEAKEGVFEAIAKQKKAETEEYRKNSAFYGLEDFIGEINRRVNRDCISTGFKKVDSLLDGGFYPGLYIIGAVSSLGKTTFALQVADNAAKSGHDVLIFSLEMAKQELIAKSLSRLSYERTKSWHVGLEFATTTRNLMNGKALQTKEQAEFMNEALKSYSTYAGNVFYHIGMGDIGIEKIKSIIEKHIRITGKKPLVIIDYLQILAPFDIRATDKQNTDKAVVELKRASRDFDIPVFAISSFNRENYTQPVNLQSFKESGAIEYTSDVLLALQFMGMDYQKNSDGRYEDEKSRTARVLALRAEQEKFAETPGQFQSIQLKVLKNRNGRKGNTELNFCPMFNYFEEPEEKESIWVRK